MRSFFLHCGSVSGIPDPGQGDHSICAGTAQWHSQEIANSVPALDRSSDLAHFRQYIVDTQPLSWSRVSVSTAGVAARSDFSTAIPVIAHCSRAAPFCSVSIFTGTRARKTNSFLHSRPTCCPWTSPTTFVYRIHGSFTPAARCMFVLKKLGTPVRECCTIILELFNSAKSVGTLNTGKVSHWVNGVALMPSRGGMS